MTGRIKFFGGPSVFILTAENDAGHAWIAEHVAITDETIHAFGGIVVEWRYAQEIAAGARRDGVEVGGER